MQPQRLKVLLVEDSPADARLIQESLAETSDNPFDLEITDTLAAGLQRLVPGDIDAMLLDLALPDSFGQDTFHKAKSQALGVPIIVLTGLKDDSLALKLVEGGAQDFVAKVDINGNNLTRAILYAIERERAEQQVRMLNDELERRVKERTAALEASNKELEAFSYTVSHDLRGPLTHLHGYSTLLADKSAQLDADGQRYVQRIKDAAMRMSLLIEDLLKLARVGRQKLALRDVGLGPLIDQVRKDLEPDTADRKIDWRIRRLPLVACDYGLIKQVLTNLLSNAIKYTRPRPHAVIEVGETLVDGESAFFVRDNGVGFDMKAAEKLFAPFQRFHRHEDFEGAGIGLATVQRIIQKHGGHIWAQSEPDQGATFFFTLTLSESKAHTTRRRVARA